MDDKKIAAAVSNRVRHPRGRHDWRDKTREGKKERIPCGEQEVLIGWGLGIGVVKTAPFRDLEHG